MVHSIRVYALATALLAGTAAAQDSSPADADQSWLDSTIARCVQQYDEERCHDQQFLDEHFHVTSLQVAHHAAMRRHQLEQKALRELTLQHVCSMSASDICGNDADPARCLVQIQQSCGILQAEASNCAAAALQACASAADPGSCSQSRIALCPSLQIQPIEQLLAKYPRLSASQKSRLIAADAELDAKTGGWWSHLVAWIKTPLN